MLLAAKGTCPTIHVLHQSNNVTLKGGGDIMVGDVMLCISHDFKIHMYLYISDVIPSQGTDSVLYKMQASR